MLLEMDTYSNFVLLGLLALFTGAGGLRDVVLKVPMAVPSGATATLLCLYDLEGDQLYTIKWYKGRQEFFRYVPKELPHTRVFALPGINVDVVASGMEAVVLRDVKRSLTGKYRCEVSTDAPHFLTEVVMGYLHVVDALESKPELQLEKNSYSVGDTLRGNCSSPPSSPPANVTWYVNGDLEESSWQSVQGTNSSKEMTTTSISLELTPESFPGGKLHLKCVADLFSITKTSEEVWLEEDRPRLASVLGSRGAAACSAPSAALLSQMVLAVVRLYCCR